MTTRTATCSCGQLRLTVRGDPIRISICHCLACQQRTGSLFGAQARYNAEQVSVVGESTIWVRAGDSGESVRFRFCPRCGSTVYYTLDVVPGTVGVPIGGFADPSFPQPRVSIYESCRHPWLQLPDAIARED